MGFSLGGTSLRRGATDDSIAIMVSRETMVDAPEKGIMDVSLTGASSV